MVPLESLTKRSITAEPTFRVRAPARRAEPEEPKPRAPRRFKVVDLMTRQALVDGDGMRATVDALRGVRSVVDVNVYVWQEERDRWRRLTFPERRALWELARA
jgi:hypothetical protein